MIKITTEPVNQTPTQQSQVSNILSHSLNQPQFNWYKVATFGLLFIVVITGSYLLGLKSSSTVNSVNSTVINIKLSPQPTQNIYRNTYSCQIDSDCTKYNIGKIADCGPIQCINSYCQQHQPCGPYRPPTPIMTLEVEIDMFITANKGKINQFYYPEGSIQYINSEPFFNDVYIANLKLLDKTGQPVATEGIYVLVAKENGQWLLGMRGNVNYCRWLKASDKDDATKAFMGIEECR